MIHAIIEVVLFAVTATLAIYFGMKAIELQKEINKLNNKTIQDNEQ